MYRLYLGESGIEDNPADRHFVLGGDAVFERVTFHLASALDALQQLRSPSSHSGERIIAPPGGVVRLHPRLALSPRVDRPVPSRQKE